MRVISGTAKGRKLAEFKGKNIRPTPDRVREALFSSLGSRFGSLNGLRTLDLYAGSGAMTIEALSRGAEKGILVDKDRDAEKLIRQNLASTGLSEKAKYKNGDVLKILSTCSSDGPFDLIFMDPPYGDNVTEQLLIDLNRFGLLDSDGIICVETSSKITTPDSVENLTCLEKRKYGSTLISYYGFQKAEID